MANTKISAATSKTTPAGTEEVPLNDSGVSKRMTLSNLVSLVTRASLGLATSDSPQFTGIQVGHASDTTLARASAGNLTVEGNALYRAGGTDVPVADGGTGASTAAGARTNLGLDEIDYVQVTTATTTVSATTPAGAGTIITGSTVAYDGSTAVIIEFYCNQVHPAGSGYVVINIWEDGSDIGRLAVIYNTAGSLTGRLRITPTNGSHQYVLKAWRTVGNGTLDAGSGGSADAITPMFMRISRA